ncbi:MAG: aspartate--tRNA ligase [Ruminococcaceae bacterium]|nr:aspartate--tRNA ligase [Oscillospiraceae bacterium]
MAEYMNGIKRTNYNAQVTKELLGKEVVLTGWTAKTRNLGSLIFIDLRDRTGLVQLVFDSETNTELFEKAASVRNEFVLAIKGIVRERAPEAVNTRMATGEIEVFVSELRILNEAQTPPFHIDDKANVSDVIRLKYRYLDLRRPSLQSKLIMRHKIAKVARDYFDENNFLEIETPFLTKSTPEGARDYLVPSRVHHGKFYALPQSPQIFKQLLMMSGFDRYIQIVKCFRDEDLRADRQPEFTQIDLEMSFVEADDVISINEGFLKRLFKETLNIDLPTPFLRMPYKEAMERYGSDKPDIRFGLELKDLSNFAENCSFAIFSNAVKEGGAVRAISAPAGHFTRKEIDKLTEFVKTQGGSGMAWISVGETENRSSVSKVLTADEIQEIIKLTDSKAGDLICIVSGKSNTVYTVLGALRCELAKKLELIDESKFAFLWITEFPLFEYSEEENRYVAMHHPFTSPIPEDIDKIETDPANCRANAYDIVLNGYEIGGGSIRIHDNKLQQTMFKALGFTEESAQERFGFLLDAFKYGAPPHGGLAYGLDRLAMLICGTDNIKDVIAFPKVQNASCLMSQAPDFVETQQLTDLDIAIVEKDTAQDE